MTRETAQQFTDVSSLERKCRFCGSASLHTFVDLGMSPPCESVRRPEEMDFPEVYYPLHVFVCDQCWLVQLREYIPPDEIFTEYAYFSSMSDSWLEHAKKYVEEVVPRFGLSEASQVIEIASNDGYLLKNFVTRGIPALGIEPAANVAKVAETNGIKSLVRFFGSETAQQLVSQGTQADLLLGNNVLAHVPDLNDFVGGLKILLNDEGVITMEFPHLLQLMNNNQFDTIYHEHYSYLSLLTVEQVFQHHGLRIFDVDELRSHGGSLRIYATHTACKCHEPTASLDRVIKDELNAGLNRLGSYQAFRTQIENLKLDIMTFLIDAKRRGKTVAGYGAPGKGITLLNYCGIRCDLIAYTVDRNPYKQGTFMPGTGIRIHSPDYLREQKPDYVFILPWNLKSEIIDQLSDLKDMGCKFVIPIPELTVI